MSDLSRAPSKIAQAWRMVEEAIAPSSKGRTPAFEAEDRGSSPRGAAPPPTRYELSFLIGPCTEKEAEELMVDLFDASGGRLGAVGSLGLWEARSPEEETPAALREEEK